MINATYVDIEVRMTFDSPAAPSAPTTAEVIDRGMTESVLTNAKLAKILGTTPSVLAAIRSDRLSVPLAWVPTIGGLIGYDTANLMTLAIAEQGHEMLVAIADALLWDREAIQHEWIELLTEIGGGILPDPDDVPHIVRALRDAIKDDSATH